MTIARDARAGCIFGTHTRLRTFRCATGPGRSGTGATLHGSPTSCATGVSAGRRCLVWRRKRGEAGRASFANTCDRRETRQSDGITEQHGLQRTSATKSARTGLSDNSASPSRLSLLLQPHYFQISHHLSDLVSQILRHSACWASQDALSGPPSSGCGLIHSA
jgi:hypothetical protein